MSQSVSTELPEENEGGNANGGPRHCVGIGASAGGLEALDSFFESMPPDSGMSFVVVQHLSPQHKSLMVELLSKRTQMPVRRAEHGMPVEPNTVYLIPPSKNLSIHEGKLQLSEMDSPRGVNLPIDFFLRSLAEDQGDRSVAIVLSGTGSDGMRGVRAVKEAGGLVMVQDVDSATFDGMPRSAISTGLADFILAPQQMPRQLINFVQHPYTRKGASGSKRLLSEEENMAEVFSLLRERSGVDFTYYKPTTVVRRVERRMSVTQTRGLREYLEYLRTSPREVGALKKELLIGVTSFFRDRDAFGFIEEHVLPKLFEQAEGGSLRFWVAGCSSGEEAYGLAILCRKYIEQTGKAYDVKIFATDIDPDVVEQAGTGVYPESIAADIDNALLARFFVKRGERYHIPRSIREMVVFAQHNVVKDPPFTRIDLLTCRNLLIYLQPVLQKKALSLFQFSIRSGGYLFLGSSESVGDLSDHFELVSSKWKVYRARTAGRPNLVQALATPQVGGYTPRLRGHPVHPQDDERVLDRVLQTLAGRHMPPGAIVDQNMEIVHVIGDISEFFTVPAGRISTDISKLATRDLSVPIATGLHRVFQGGQEVSYENIHVPGRDGDTRLVNLHLRPVAERRGQQPLAVVLLETAREEHESAGGDAVRYNVNKEAEHRIADLEQELQYTKENLQATIEELETSNEELQATNEELLASNQELQSTNEELQSVNEELYTVNAEYQAKIVELTNLTNDIDNLLRSTGVSTLFLDMKLCIRKFTPGITEILNVVDQDLGRPIVHFNPALAGIDLHQELRRVRDEEVHVEVEVRTNDGDWHLLRALPYRTEQNEVDGLVVAFIDITALKRAEASRKGVESQLAHERDVLRVVTDTTSSGILIYTLDGGLTFANPQAARILDMPLDALKTRGYNDPAWEVREPDGTPVPEDQLPFRQTLEQRREIRDRVLDVRASDSGGPVRLRVNSAPLLDDEGNVDAVVLTLLRAEEDA